MLPMQRLAIETPGADPFLQFGKGLGLLALLSA